MQRWEYMTLSYKRHYGRTDYRVNGTKNPKLKDKILAEVMNMLGEQGWELIGISNPLENEFTFKRPKQPRAAAPQVPGQQPATRPATPPVQP